MGFEQEVSYCPDCLGVWYPAILAPCVCNGKYRLVIAVSLSKALEISKLREDTRKYVRIIDGELQTGDSTVSEAGDGATGNGNEPDILAQGKELPDSGGPGAERSSENTPPARRDGEDHDDLEGTV